MEINENILDDEYDDSSYVVIVDNKSYKFNIVNEKRIDKPEYTVYYTLIVLERTFTEVLASENKKKTEKKYLSASIWKIIINSKDISSLYSILKKIKYKITFITITDIAS